MYCLVHICVYPYLKTCLFFCNRPGFRGYGLIGKTLILHIFVSGSIPDISNYILNHNIKKKFFFLFFYVYYKKIFIYLQILLFNGDICFFICTKKHTTHVLYVY